MKKTFTVCDRCGKEYSYDEWPKVTFRGEISTQIRLLAWRDDSTPATGGERVDLCKECRIEFRQWFQNPIRKDVEQ